MYHVADARSDHFALHAYRDIDHYIRMQGNGNGKFADRFKRAIGQTHLRFLDRGKTLLGQRGRDVHAGYRAEQTAIDTGLLRNDHGKASQLFADSLRSGKLFGLGFFELGAARFEFFERGFRGAAGNFLGIR